MCLVLIGYSGTGKTSAAEILSKRFHSKLISTDAIIILKTGMCLSQIVEKNSPDYYLDIESQIINKL